MTVYLLEEFCVPCLRCAAQRSLEGVVGVDAGADRDYKGCNEITMT
jgi:hypothetical protein